MTRRVVGGSAAALDCRDSWLALAQGGKAALRMLAEVEQDARKQPWLGRTRAGTVAVRESVADEQYGHGELPASCVALRWVRCRAEAW